MRTSMIFQSKSWFIKIIFGIFKLTVISLYFIHSLEVIIYSGLQYKYVCLELFEGINSITKFNLLSLNYVMNILYFLMTSFLIVEYNRRGQGFIHKKVFFIIITISICHVFFEYHWFCTHPSLNSFFSTILVILVSRSIASYFSNNRIFKHIYRHGNEENQVLAPIEIKDVANVVHFFMDPEDPENLKNLKTLKKYRVGSTEGHVYICKEKEKEKTLKGVEHSITFKVLTALIISLSVLTLGPIRLISSMIFILIKLFKSLFGDRTLRKLLLESELSQILSNEYFYFMILNKNVYFCKLEKIVEEDFEMKCDRIEFLWLAIKKNFIEYFTIFENKIILEKIRQT